MVLYSAPPIESGVRSTIIKALNMARKWGDLKRDAPNPAADTEIEPVIEQKPATLDDAHLDQLLAAIAGHELEPLILVALGTGYRIASASACSGRTSTRTTKRSI
jgi:hypothetical protein